MMTEQFKSYDEMKQEIIEMALEFKAVAKTKIPKLAIALKVEHPSMPKEEIKDIILKDFVQYWTRQTITDALGDEYKDEKKKESGKKGGQRRGKKKSLLESSSKELQKNTPIVISNDGTPLFQNNNLDETPDTSKLPVKDSDQFYNEQNNRRESLEEPTELELAQIRIQQLEDSIKKMGQFKQSTELERNPVIEKAVLTEETVFEWLAKRHDKQTCFYFDTYGTNLLNSRIIENLKNSGVKVFRRLYFEV